jgi:hypothetical protein
MTEKRRNKRLFSNLALYFRAMASPEGKWSGHLASIAVYSLVDSILHLETIVSFD